jgi:hypothetical protein
MGFARRKNINRLIENYSLLEDSDKPYYLVYYWNSGISGSFVSEEDVKDTIREFLIDGEQYDTIELYRASDMLKLEFSYKINIDLNIEESREIQPKRRCKKAAKKKHVKK